ncbi:pyridoxamine 5'-phosphate oxidase family protein [Haloferacaceae archaeon DSL9]
MVTVTGAWSRDEIAAFCADAVIPLRLSCRTPAGHPWMLSLWFRYVDGGFRCATSASADVVAYLDHDDEVAFEISTNDPPYKGVRGRGRATVEPDPEKALLRDLLRRYLGGTDSDLAASLLSPERDEVRITIEPARLYSWDFSDRM